MADVPAFEKNKTESARPDDSGRVSVDDHSGQFGVSDKRRELLSQMERAAGIQHEAESESSTLRPPAKADSTTGQG